MLLSGKTGHQNTAGSTWPFIALLEHSRKLQLAQVLQISNRKYRSGYGSVILSVNTVSMETHEEL